MLVSWSWLSRYIQLPLTPEELGNRFALAGLNLESISKFGDDPVIDLEITSNRGDCLGHLGVAREASVLLGKPLTVPDPKPREKGPAIASLVSLENRYPEACPRYLARVIQNVRIGPSPQWLADCLRAVGVGVVNNVVDVTNFVMLECGQPLHAFDLAKVRGKQIIVRRAQSQETIEAIDHRSYALLPDDCVIADRERAIAVAGVMGGAETEVSGTTTDLLIEAAEFAPLAVRLTARRLKLRSPSSYRFERKVDSMGLDWASRRCCELILEMAGGSLALGCLETHPAPAPRAAVTLRWEQILRVLGIAMESSQAREILTALGCRELSTSEKQIVVTPPSWRHDLTREIDLIEELARVHGYEKIPEDSPIPVVPSRMRPEDIAMQQIRGVLTATSFCEAMTPSLVPATTESLISPWTDLPALETITPMLEGAKRLRRSLLPSLLVSRQANESASGLEADLYEISHVYLPQSVEDSLPREGKTLALVTGRDFFATKGIVEELLRRLGVADRLTVAPFQAEILDRELSVSLMLAGERIGCLGVVTEEARRNLKLQHATTVCELNLQGLLGRANLVPQYRLISPFPAIMRDLNFVLEETVTWSGLESSIREAAGTDLVEVHYVETYRDAAKDGANKKRVLVTLMLQRTDATLSGSDADRAVMAAVQRCEQTLGAKLLSS